MPVFTFRGMARFSCIGPACENTCCQDWRVPVVDHDIVRLATRLRPEELGNIEKDAIRMRPDGTCPFLGSDLLCAVHRRFGEELLPDTCAAYPRVIGRMGTRFEISGVMSCPEVARQFLLHDDALEIEPATEKQYGRGQIKYSIDGDSQDLYLRGFSGVRGLALHLITQRRFPVSMRLYFLAALADLARDELKQEAPMSAAPRLQQIGGSFRHDPTLDAIASHAESESVDDTFGLSVVRALVQLPPGLVSANLAKLLAAVSGERPPRLSDELEARLEVLIERFVAHFLVTEWFIEEEDFTSYVFHLLIRVALNRFIIRSLATPGLTSDGLDALAVRVIHTESRTLQHNSNLETRLKESIDKAGKTLPHALSLLKV